MTRKKCPLCSRASLIVESVIAKFTGSILDCQGISEFADDKGKQRISEINKAAPDCNCENYRMSNHSPDVIGNNELLVRFVFSPMHVDSKGKIKPSIFSQVTTNGCSIQRGEASTEELLNFVESMLSDETKVWKGVLVAKCDDVRNIKKCGSENRAVCVYDTASQNNPFHGEMMHSQHIDDADSPDIRKKVSEAFNHKQLIKPDKYRNGEIWNKLPSELQRV